MMYFDMQTKISKVNVLLSEDIWKTTVSFYFLAIGCLSKPLVQQQIYVHAGHWSRGALSVVSIPVILLLQTPLWLLIRPFEDFLRMWLV